MSSTSVEKSPVQEERLEPAILPWALRKPNSWAAVSVARPGPCVSAAAEWRAHPSVPGSSAALLLTSCVSIGGDLSPTPIHRVRRILASFLNKCRIDGTLELTSRKLALNIHSSHVLWLSWHWSKNMLIRSDLFFIENVWACLAFYQGFIWKIPTFLWIYNLCSSHYDPNGFLTLSLLKQMFGYILLYNRGPNSLMI